MLNRSSGDGSTLPFHITVLIHSVKSTFSPFGILTINPRYDICLKFDDALTGSINLGGFISHDHFIVSRDVFGKNKEYIGICIFLRIIHVLSIIISLCATTITLFTILIDDDAVL
jgi:hypothetical protein